MPAPDDVVKQLTDQLEMYLAAFYPHMPATAREAIVRRYMKRPLVGRLPVVAGIVTNNHARHQFTEYELLLDELSQRGVEQARTKARRLVADHLNQIIKKWCRGAPVSHPELGAIRRSYKRIYKQRKHIHGQQKCLSVPQTDLNEIVANENAELAEFCRRWLYGHFETIEELQR